VSRKLPVRPDGWAPSAMAYLLLTRLPGTRWADRRPLLNPAQLSRLTATVGRLLRGLHRLPGRRYGSVTGAA
jgi:hygromycin-B 7''-O-kinase